MCANGLNNYENKNNVNNCTELSDVNKCLGKIQEQVNLNITCSSLQLINCDNLIDTNVSTESNVSWELPCHLVEQEKMNFSEKIPVWDRKLAKQMKLQKASTVPDFQKWKMQNKFTFGFIPLSPLVGVKNWQENDTVYSPTEAYQLVKNSGVYNHQKVRLLLKNQLNSVAWEEHLQDYWDWQLVQYIKFRFSLDIKPDSQLSCDYSNHKSATLFPSPVETYLEEEKGFGAIFGPFSEKPCIVAPY